MSPIFRCMVKVPGLEDELKQLFERFVQDVLLTFNRPEWPVGELMLSVIAKFLLQQLLNPFPLASVNFQSVTDQTPQPHTAQASSLHEISVKTAALDFLGT